MKLVHYKLRKEHQMQKYSTIIGVIELRQSDIGYRTTKKRYNIGNSTVTLIMNRFHELGLSLEELKAMPPKKVEEAFYPPENLRRAEKELPDFFQIHQRMMALETPDLAFQWLVSWPPGFWTTTSWETRISTSATRSTIWCAPAVRLL